MRSLDRAWRCCARRPGRAKTIHRLIGVPARPHRLRSVTAAAKAIEEAVGAPYALVHNAGISAAGMVEEAPDESVGAHVRHPRLGPGRADQSACCRRCGRRAQGRIVLVSSAGGSARNARNRTVFRVKGALSGGVKSMAGEIAPFGLGVTILVTGTYDTDIITDAGTTDDRDFSGPYAAITAPWTTAAASR